MKKLLLIYLLTFTVTLVIAQPKSDYYRSIDGKSKATLKTTLGSIIINHTQLTYTGTLPSAYPDVYYMDDNSTKVYDIFSQNIYEYSDGSWNKEHVVPKSWWGGSANKAYSDLFSVIPSDAEANTHKSNYPIGLVYSSDFDNGRIKVGTPVTGTGGSYKKVFEPCDDFKGDFARIYFYVATCYPNIGWGEGTVDSEIVKEDWPTLKPWLYELLLKWHNEDPVSDKEVKINNAVETKQGNRNPFIDYPVLADYIWGSKTEETFNLESAALYRHLDGEGPSGNRVAKLYYPYVVKLGEKFVAPTLTSDTNGEKTFSSSNPAVASVNEATGDVTIKAAGTAIITVKTAETTNYEAGTASYMIEVTE